MHASLIVARFGSGTSSGCRGVARERIRKAIGDRDACRASNLVREHIGRIHEALDFTGTRQTAPERVSVLRADHGRPIAVPFA